MIVAVEAQHLPVATIFRVIGVVVVDMMYRQFTQIRIDKLTRAASADPGEELQRFFAISDFQPGVVLRDISHNTHAFCCK